jgi:flagellar assembly factor FliW
MSHLTNSERIDDVEREVSGVSVDAGAVISFPDGLPGFEACRRFVLITSPELEPLRQLQAVTGPDASFIGLDPKCVLPNYRCELNEFDLERLGAHATSPLLWLAIIAIEADGTATANLRAPVVINPETMIGYQVMPHRCLYALRHVISVIE